MLEIVLHLKQPFLENKTKLIETLTTHTAPWLTF